jgi:hypothetical protein
MGGLPGVYLWRDAVRLLGKSINFGLRPALNQAGRCIHATRWEKVKCADWFASFEWSVLAFLSGCLFVGPRDIRNIASGTGPADISTGGDDE